MTSDSLPLSSELRRHLIASIALHRLISPPFFPVIFCFLFFHLSVRAAYQIHVPGEVVLDDGESDDDLSHGDDELRRPEKDEQEEPAPLLDIFRVLEAPHGETVHRRRRDLFQKEGQ